MKAQLVASATRDGKVFKVSFKKDGTQKRILLNRRPTAEYVNSIQLYNANQPDCYQDYFEQDPFTKRENEIMKVVEGHKSVQREYSIMKDLCLTKFISSFIYGLIDKSYKNGKKEFPLVEFFKRVSTEEEIRPCYGYICSGGRLHNGLDFKDLGISKFDRVNRLREMKILNDT